MMPCTDVGRPCVSARPRRYTVCAFFFLVPFIPFPSETCPWYDLDIMVQDYAVSPAGSWFKSSFDGGDCANRRLARAMALVVMQARSANGSEGEGRSPLVAADLAETTRSLALLLALCCGQTTDLCGGNKPWCVEYIHGARHGPAPT